METTPVDLSKLSDVIEKDVVKKIEYDELVEKLLMLFRLVNLLKKTDYEGKINEINCKIPSITSLATTTALNDVKN